MHINSKKENKNSEHLWMLYFLWIGLVNKIILEGMSSILDTKIEKIKKKKINISLQVIKKIEEGLSAQVDQNKMYLNPKLTLDIVAKRLNYPVYAVSWVLNNHMKTNFSDFVNQMRIQEAKKLIDQGYLEKQTIISLAFDSGFNSKSSFNRIFKLKTGITPTQYTREKKKQSFYK